MIDNSVDLILLIMATKLQEQLQKEKRVSVRRSACPSDHQRGQITTAEVKSKWEKDMPKFGHRLSGEWWAEAPGSKAATKGK